MQIPRLCHASVTVPLTEEQSRSIGVYVMQSVVEVRENHNTGNHNHPIQIQSLNRFNPC